MDDLSKYQLIPYKYDSMNKYIYNEYNKQSSGLWKRIIRLISLYTHPDKTSSNFITLFIHFI